MTLNLPNKLTVSRLVMTLIFLVFAAIPREHAWQQGDTFLIWKIGYCLAVVAAFTDFFDGYIARKYNLVTDFGKLMDPLSDKVYTISCFVMLSYYHYVPFWITCLILTREFAVNGLRTLAAKHGTVIAAKNIGKIKTVLQMLVLAFGGALWAWGVDLEDRDGNVLERLQYLYWGWQFLLWSITALTVYSGIEYFWKGRELYLKDA